VRKQQTFRSLAKRSFAFWFGGIWLSVGALILIIGVLIGVHSIRQHERFKNEAQVADGMVLNKWISRQRREGRESTSYWIGYRFSAPNGAVVKREAQVSSEMWDRLVERERVRVMYLPSDPATSRIEAKAQPGSCRSSSRGWGSCSPRSAGSSSSKAWPEFGAS
jgi:hypothetical protein